MKEKLTSLAGALLAVVGAAPTWTTAGIVALLGLAGGAAAAVMSWLAPVLIGVSVLLLGRAFYILYVRRRGTRLSAVITWASAFVVVGYWTWRLIESRF